MTLMRTNQHDFRGGQNHETAPIGPTRQSINTPITAVNWLGLVLCATSAVMYFKALGPEPRKRRDWANGMANGRVPWQQKST